MSIDGFVFFERTVKISRSLWYSLLTGVCFEGTPFGSFRLALTQLRPRAPPHLPMKMPIKAADRFRKNLKVSQLSSDLRLHRRQDMFAIKRMKRLSQANGVEQMGSSKSALSNGVKEMGSNKRVDLQPPATWSNMV